MHDWHDQISGDTPETQCAALLCAAIRSGDRDAETALVERYGVGLEKLLLRICPDPATAEDIYQETFRVAIEKLRSGSISEPERLSQYLQGIARRLLSNLEKKTQRQKTTPDQTTVEKTAGTGGEPANQIDEYERAATVLAAIAALPNTRDQLVIERYFLIGHGREEICQELAISRTLFKSVLHRALRRLRGQLETSGYY